MNTRSNTTPASAVRHTAIVSLGANLPSTVGLPLQSLRQAVVCLRQWGCGVFRVSSLYCSAPVDCPAGTPDFFNAIVTLEVEGLGDPFGLLQSLQRLEREFGRVRDGTRNQSRVLDLDLVALGPHRCRHPRLVLPHPRAHERRFVLEPLAELLPELVLPGQAENVRCLLANLPADQSCLRLAVRDWSRLQARELAD